MSSLPLRKPDNIHSLHWDIKLIALFSCMGIILTSFPNLQEDIMCIYTLWVITANKNPDTFLCYKKRNQRNCL